MSSKELKQIRGQIRQIVKELLPEMLSENLTQTLYNRLSLQLTNRLVEIDERQKDLQSYMVRNSIITK
jgi:hypothetical protein